MTDWTSVCHIDEIPMLGSRVIAREGRIPIAVFRTADDTVFALLDQCPHKGGALSQGIVCEKTVTCPLHQWHISLDEGTAIAPDQGSTPTFPIKVEDRMVYIDLSVSDHG
jgi:nitrite reductase (NADH) small subunit